MPADQQFLEYVYAVLPAWGIHRMGAQRAKVTEYDQLVGSLPGWSPLSGDDLTYTCDALDARWRRFGEPFAVADGNGISRARTHSRTAARQLAASGQRSRRTPATQRK